MGIYDFLSKFEAQHWAVFLFVSMFLFTSIGMIIGNRLYKDSDKEDIVLTCLFTLFGLLVGFTFSMAVYRHDKRIDILVQESNDIGTAILRADLYPAEQRQLFREDFKKYTELRIAYFNSTAESKEETAILNETDALAQKIWKRATEYSSNHELYVASLQMIPALNNMIDIANTRTRISKEKVPGTVLWLVYILACTCTFYAGFVSAGKGRLKWIYHLGFCLLSSAVLYLLMDMDRSRSGLITLERTNQAIVDLLKMFK